MKKADPMDKTPKDSEGLRRTPKDSEGLRRTPKDSEGLQSPNSWPNFGKDKASLQIDWENSWKANSFKHVLNMSFGPSTKKLASK